MYLHTMVQVSSHVFAYYGSNEQSCICILWFKWSVMYLYTMVQVISHVFAYYGSNEQSCIAYYGSNEQSCICILWFKWAVMYLHTMVQVISHVFCLLKVSPLSLSTMFLLDFELFPTVWYFCFCFSFYQLLCSSYMYGNMIYTNRKVFINPSFDHLSM
jgi:hypothetical protein